MADMKDKKPSREDRGPTSKTNKSKKSASSTLYASSSSQREIVLDSQGMLVAGTIEAIVYYLLNHVKPVELGTEDTSVEAQEKRRRIEQEQNQLLQVFIISYRQFVSPTRFFLILEDKFISSDMTGRIAVMRMLSVWLDKYLDRDFFFHDKGNRLFDQLLKFVSFIGSDEIGFGLKANELKLLILRVKCRRKRRHGSAIAGFNMNSPKTITDTAEETHTETPFFQDTSPSPRKAFSLCEMSLVALAEQLTLIERNMFRAIKEREFLNLNWKRPENKRNSRHIVKMVERFNKVSYWVATRIVREMDQKRRTSLLKRFIILAEKCAELNNYNTLMEVLAGLNLHPVQRLKETWKGLSDKYRELMENLERLMENKQNYKAYRERLMRVQETGESALPYLGVYLRDLTFIEEGNTTNTEDGLVNYEKIQLVGQVIREVQYFQVHSQYPDLKPSEEWTTLKYLKKLRGLRQDQLDEKSRQCEAMKNPQ